MKPKQRYYSQGKRMSQRRPTGVPQAMAQAVDLMRDLEGLKKLEELIGPMREVVEQLPPQLEAADQALQKAQTDNDELRGQLELQRKVFLRMFAEGMDLPLEQVLSMEAAMRKQVTSDEHANETTRTDEEQA